MGGERHRLLLLRDPERMREVMARHLRWADHATVDVRSCEVAYLHAAPNRCLLQFDLVVRDQCGGAPVGTVASPRHGQRTRSR